MSGEDYLKSYVIILKSERCRDAGKVYQIRRRDSWKEIQNSGDYDIYYGTIFQLHKQVNDLREAKEATDHMRNSALSLQYALQNKMYYSKELLEVIGD